MVATATSVNDQNKPLRTDGYKKMIEWGICDWHKASWGRSYRNKYTVTSETNLWHVTIKAKRSYITVTWQWSRETLTEWRFTTLLPSLTWTGDAESGWTLRIRLNCDVAMTKQNQKVHRSWSKLWAKTCTPRNPTRATRMMDMTASIGNTFLEIKKKQMWQRILSLCGSNAVCLGGTHATVKIWTIMVIMMMIICFLRTPHRLFQGFPTFLRSRTTRAPCIVNTYNFFHNNYFDRIFVYSEE